MTTASAARASIDAIVRYDARFVGDGRDPACLRLKLDLLCASPHGRLSGTLHPFVAARPALGAFDFELEVSEFDETAPFTPALDLAPTEAKLEAGALGGGDLAERGAVARALGLAGSGVRR